MLDSLAIVKTPRAARKLFQAALWKVRTREKKLYLTFDDGPIDDVTPQVLDILKQYNAKATFFCIGKNIVTSPSLFHRIAEEGHTIGNHTQDHLNGWNTDNKIYFDSVEQCAQVKSANMRVTVSADKEGKLMQTNFFRPPYGKISLSQYRYLKKTYKIVMWDVLAFDFDLKVTKEQVLENVLQNSVPGSIIVFHDSLKAKEKMLYALPKVLEHYSQLGYLFEALPE